MGKSSPKPTPANETAAAQTGANVNTAIANSYMGNITENTPDGSTSLNKTGEHSWTDGFTGQTYNVPTWTRTTTLSDGAQAIKDQQDSAKLNLATLGADQSGRISEILKQGMDYTDLPEAGDAGQIRPTNLSRVGSGPQLQTGVRSAGDITRNIEDAGDITKTYGTDFSQDRQRVEDTLFARMNPSIERDKERLEARLASQGIRMGSEAYSASMDDFGRSVNDARYGAILNAGNEQSRLTGMEAQRAAFENAAQGQQFGQNAATAQFSNAAQGQQYGQNLQDAQFGNSALSEMFNNKLRGSSVDNQSAVQEANADIARVNAQNATRSQALQEKFASSNDPINKITALLSGSQVAQPQFMGANIASIPTTDNAGIISNYDNQRMQAAQSKNAMTSNIIGGAMGFGANLIASDERVKKDIKEVGKTKDGQNIYQFRYKSGGPIQMGLMAQEVEKKKPSAVKNVGGVKMVNYGIALGGRK